MKTLLLVLLTLPCFAQFDYTVEYIDSDHPSIEYEGNWKLKNTGYGTYPQSLGDTLSFTFTGTRIVMFTEVSLRHKGAGYELDGIKSNTIISTRAQDEEDKSLEERVWDSGPLANKEHTLRLWGARNNGRGFVLNKFEITKVVPYKCVSDTIKIFNLITNDSTYIFEFDREDAFKLKGWKLQLVGPRKNN